MGGDSSQFQSHSQIFLRQGHNFWTKVDVRASGELPCFSDIYVEPQYPSLGFY